MAQIHPFYEKHRGAMEAAMRQRLDLAEEMLRERAQLSLTRLLHLRELTDLIPAEVFPGSRLVHRSKAS